MTGTSLLSISADELHALMTSQAEYALLDVRPPRRTADEGSILLAVSLPLDALELSVFRLVPRKSTSIVVYSSAGDGLSLRGARRLRELGYADVRELEGGIQAWSVAGYKVHTGGDRVIGQAFGEFIEDVYGTPHITVGELRARLAAGEDLVLLDSRPLPEFEVHSLPGGVSIPGAELVFRAGEVIRSDETLIVVNCAGRTRSIVGAQALINAGLPNKVVALEGGTQSWYLDGYPLDHGKSNEVNYPSAASLELAHQRARGIAARFGVRNIDKATIERFRAEQEERTLYLLDVRTPQEFLAGHLPGSKSAPSWDVAPWVFRHAATHNARIVLIDTPDLVRGTVTASWLIQFGWGEIYVAADGLDGPLETGPQPSDPLVSGDLSRYRLTAQQVRDESAAGLVQVVDLQSGRTFSKAHVPDAIYAARARLVQDAARIPGSGGIVLTSEDGRLADLALVELQQATERRVWVLGGGNAAWQAAGLPFEQGEGRQLHEPLDVVDAGWLEDDPERRMASFRRYLSWEVGLVAELRDDDTVPFRRFA